MSNNHPITFGVEFEFIVPQAAGPDSHPNDDRFYQTKRYAQEDGDIMGPIVVNCLKDVVPIVEDDQSWTCLQLANKRGINLEHDHALPYSYFWKTSFEGSLQARPEEDVTGNYTYWQHPVEVSSRILGEHEFDEVARVYRQLRASLRINLNSSCSFHVHVGTAHLDLLGYQRLATLIMVCEPFLWRCCETFRRDGWWCLSISSYSKTARVRDQRPLNPKMHAFIPKDVLSPSLYDSLRGIWAATSIPDLRDQLLVQRGGDCGDYYGRGGFFIHKSYEADVYGEPCPTNTAEFRYSHASGDAERDGRFVRICIALVRAAELDAPTYTATIASFAKGGDFSNFLDPLNLQELHGYFRAAEREYIRRGEEPSKPATEFLPRI